MTKVLEVRNLVKEFPGVKALQGVDLDVLEAEVHCLLGPNGISEPRRSCRVRAYARGAMASSRGVAQCASFVVAERLST